MLLPFSLLDFSFELEHSRLVAAPAQNSVLLSSCNSFYEVDRLDSGLC